MPRNPAISPVRSPGTGAGRGSADARVAAPSAPAGRVTRAGAAALLSPPRSPRRNAGPQTTQVNGNVTSPGPASPGRQRGRDRASGDLPPPPPTGAATQDGTDPAPLSLLDALQSVLEPSDSGRTDVAQGQSSVALLQEPASGLLPASPAGPGERNPPMPPAQPLVLGGSVMGSSAAT